MRRKGILIGLLSLLVIIATITGIIIYVTNQEGDEPASTTISPTPKPTHAPAHAPTVTVEQGTLEGVWRKVQRNEILEYAAFFGIPFAQAPVQDLRFKAPKPVPAWSGTRKADKEGPICAQLVGTDIRGSEDCLYLNVYTPSLPSESDSRKRAVYVFIHGGALMGGSAEIYQLGPDFFIPQDVIVVTVQYRVNSFGFLSLDTEDIPGNCGLKDNIAALQWVHQNIAQFGGDPDQVTIGGESAGAAMAGWLTVLPEARGLIRRAILQSGSAYHNWAYNEDHVKVALDLASLMAKKQVTDINDATKLFMEATMQELVHHTFNLFSTFTDNSGPELFLRPSPERRTSVPNGEPLLVTHDAESYFIRPAVPRVPHIISNTNAEWRLFYYYSKNPQSDPETDKNMLYNLMQHVPKDLIPHQDTRKLLGLSEDLVKTDYNSVVDEVKKALSSAVSKSCHLGCVLREYFDGIWMMTDTHRLAKLRARENAETYVFRFSVRTELNRPYPVSPLPADEEGGAGHADDLPYTWTCDDKPREKNGLSDLATRRMTTMWANFIKYGKPTIAHTELLPVEWLPNKETGTDVSFLEFGPDMSMRNASLSGRLITFWETLYKKYRTPSARQQHVRSL